MAQGQQFQRDKDGLRIDFLGMNTILPPDQLAAGKYPYAQNVRRYLQKATTGRAVQTSPLFTLPAAVHSLRRMNDTTPAGPPSGFVIVSGAGTSLFADGVQVQTGLSGGRISLVPFRPNQSVQPWMYVADDDGMFKVRSDGLTYLDGIEEPQDAPVVTFEGQQIPASEPGSTLLNGWGPNAHVGAYEGGVPQSVSWGLNGGVTLPYTNPGNVFDGDDTTFCDSTLQHTHQYAGVIWQFSNPSAPVIPDNLVINVLSEIPLNGSGVIVTQRSAGIWYSIDGGTTWTQIYNTSSRVKQWDSVVLPSGTDPAMVQVMAFNDSHDDMVHRVFSLTLGVQAVLTLYRYVYRSSKTGALSNPSPPSNSGFNQAVQSADIVATPSSDPQVDKIDFYRFGGGLENYTYVGTGPNTADPFVDLQPDTIVQANPILQFDNFQPFPSIDLPRSGHVNVAAGVISWVSGDKFNVRWLPGNIIVIDGVAYVTDKRPTSDTTMTATDVVDGNNVTYEIQQPALAAQPMAAMWGPTDNVAFMFACGDNLRPGTLYFTKGNNPDSAPDTNQIEVTSPSEPLMNGVIINGLSMVYSTERAWLAFPNFFNALATVTGVAGSQFTMVLAVTDRGLYAKFGLCTDGKNAYFIGKDGIYISPGGNGSESITDGDIYNIFPHEGEDPEDIVVGATGKTIFVPDWTKPEEMALSYSIGYLYFDYMDLHGDRQTLVYDAIAKGWVLDMYQFPCAVHNVEEGPVLGTLLGCEDGSIREFDESGVEDAVAQILMPAFIAGDTRSVKQWGDLYIEADIAAAQTMTVTPYVNLYNAIDPGASPTALPSSGALRAPYIVDFQNGDGIYSRDLGASFSWNLGRFTALYVWQPTIVDQPEQTQNRPTDWDDAGTQEPKFVQGLRLEANTFGIPKAFKVQSSDDLTLYTPNESPIAFNGQSIKPFTFTPPFVAHSMRVVATDGVKWSVWSAKWDFVPYPEATVEWQIEKLSFGNIGFFHLRQMNMPIISTADVNILIEGDYWEDVAAVVPSTNGRFVKVKVTLPVNKNKLVSIRAYSTQKFRLFQSDVEVKLGRWGRADSYAILKPFGGLSSEGARV